MAPPPALSGKGPTGRCDNQFDKRAGQDLMCISTKPSEEPAQPVGARKRRHRRKMRASRQDATESKDTAQCNSCETRPSCSEGHPRPVDLALPVASAPPSVCKCTVGSTGGGGRPASDIEAPRGSARTPSARAWLPLLPTIVEVDNEEHDEVDHGAGSVSVRNALVPMRECSAGDEVRAVEELSAGVLIPDPSHLHDDAEGSVKVIAMLASSDPAERRFALQWLFTTPGAVLQLSLSKGGCRVVQQAIDVAYGADREALLAQLRPHVVQLYESPHGNYVLSKLVGTLPPAAVCFVVKALLEGEPCVAVKHGFGCRVVCRIIEHCSEKEASELIDAIVADAENLFRHKFGNFVVQTLLEHGSAARRSSIVQHMLTSVPQLAMHRAGSLVLQRVLDHGSAQDHGQVVDALLHAASPCSLLEIACNHYGSFVIEQLASMAEYSVRIRDHLTEQETTSEQLKGATKISRRVVEAFDLHRSR